MKRIIKSIIITIFVLGIMGVAYWKIACPNHSEGTITIKLYNEDRTIIDSKKIAFSEDDTLEKLLEDNYEITMNGTMLIRIDSLYTPNTAEKFIKIYINNKPSQYGIKMISLQDKDEIIFIIEKTSTIGNLEDEFTENDN